MKSPTYSSEIILCTACAGRGLRVHHRVTDYHRGEYEVETHPCPICEGSGRLLANTVTTYERVAAAPEFTNEPKES